MVDTGLPVEDYWLHKAAMFEMRHTLMMAGLQPSEIDRMPKWEAKLHYDRLQKSRSESIEG